MLIDNKKTTKIGDKLKDAVRLDSKLSIVRGLFSIYAFDTLKKELSKTSQIRLLLTQYGTSDINAPANLRGGS